MTRLTAAARNAIPAGEFAGPDRSYPIQDRIHGINALSRVSQFGTGGLKRQVREQVYRKYPDLKQGD